MKKILTILGARPQFIKAAALSRVLRESGDLTEVILHTGQHFDKNMSDIFFSEMQIPAPDYKLSISGLNHGAMTGRMMERIEEIVLKENPSAILVYGDTNSTLAGALVGSKLHVPVIHVEAGLRSFNMEMPEEINRILTDRVSSLLLCPTTQSMLNLKNEGFDTFNIELEKVGDVMEDAAMFYSKLSSEKSKIIEKLKVEHEEFTLLTCHRAENTNNPLRMQGIIDGINIIAKKSTIVWPVHPRLAKLISKYQLSDNIVCIDPVGYFDMIELLKNCCLVLTDSGGLQKEAYFFNKYCITLRDQTEWVELVDEGYNYVVGVEPSKIVNTFNQLVNKKFVKQSQLYGGGKSAKNMVQSISKFLNGR